MPEANYDIVMRRIAELNIFDSESNKMNTDCQDQILNLLEIEINNNNFFYSLDYYNQNCEAFINRFKNDEKNSIDVIQLISGLMSLYPLTKNLVETLIQDHYYSSDNLDQYFTKYFELFKKRVSFCLSGKSQKYVDQNNLYKNQLDQKIEDYQKKIEEIREKIDQRKKELSKKEKEDQNYQKLAQHKERIKEEIIHLSQKFNDTIIDQLNQNLKEKKHDLKKLKEKNNQQQLLDLMRDSLPIKKWKKMENQIISSKINGGNR